MGLELEGLIDLPRSFHHVFHTITAVYSHVFVRLARQ